MCLDSKKRFWLKPGPQDVISAFKVFKGSSDERVVFSAVRPDKYRRGIWVRASVDDIYFFPRIYGGRHYPSGFHAFLSRDDAMGYATDGDIPYPGFCVLPVLLRGVHTKGKQDGSTIIVASEMLVPMDGAGTK